MPTTTSTKPQRLATLTLGVGVVLIAGLLAACAAREDDAAVSTQEIIALHDSHAFAPAGNPNPAARIQIDGFSILPPQGERWIEEPITPPAEEGWTFRIVFTKIIAQPQPQLGPHTVVAVAKTFNFPPELRQRLADKETRRRFLTATSQALVAKLRAEAEAEPSKYRLISAKADPDYSLGYDCIKGEYTVEQLADPSFVGRVFLLEVHAYRCLDPAHSMSVEMFYSQRTPRGINPIDLTSEGEPFLKSLRFAVPVS
jgi:hypothetical protein